MIVPFIPYFIAANLATDMLSWSNGPEYVFTTNVDMFIGTGYHDEDTNMTAILEIRCQPKGSDSVNCIMTPTLARMISNHHVREKPAEINDTVHFEAKFDATGIVNLTIPEEFDRARQLAMKRIASVFTVGVDLSNPSATSAQGTTERSALGECDDTVINVESHDASGNPEHLDGKTYDLYPIPLSENGRRMNVIIDKIRDPSKCSGRELYYAFMGTPSSTDIKSSVSKISISDSGSFESSTESRSKFEVPSPDGEVKAVQIYERIHASLTSVREAVETIPSVPNPKVVSIETLFEDLEDFM